MPFMRSSRSLYDTLGPANFLISIIASSGCVSSWLGAMLMGEQVDLCVERRLFFGGG